MYLAAMGDRASRMRLIIALNRWNDPRRGRDNDPDLGEEEPDEVEEDDGEEEPDGVEEGDGEGSTGAAGAGRTTAGFEAELAAAVADWQARVDALAPGQVTIIGQLVDLPVRDDPPPGSAGPGPVIDGDVWRELGSRAEYALRFPHAGTSHAAAASRTFLDYLSELYGQNGEVFVHFADSDTVDLGSI